ncbi:TPM domain-containing protein [Sphingomonas sp. CCH5-A5]|nr:hypothetical protein [Sphingomonas sp. CCH5-A5]
MAGIVFSGADHARVTHAVAEAEHGTDGEIVTIVTPRSDEYHDVALHFAVAAMLLVPALLAAAPALLVRKLALFGGGWDAGTDLALLLVGVFVVQAIVFLVVRYGLAWRWLRIRIAPLSTRERRVRRRAIQFFKAGAEKRTRQRVGILLFLSLDERIAEIVADEAIHSRVAPEIWGEAMAALVDRVRAGDAAGGMVAAVARIGAVLAEHFPKTADDVNELPDRLIEL